MQRKLVLWLLFSALHGIVFSQALVPAAEIQPFLNNTQQWVREKIFVHTDQELYTAGEILWFKLYTVAGDSLKSSDLSKVAYVEILNAAQQPVLQAKIRLQNGKGDGSFMLPATLGSGTYLFRAYTNWMKNNGADYFFQKTITIVNTLKRPDWHQLEKQTVYDVQFFPEGGNLVSGLQSTVGFKVVDQYGMGTVCSGVVLSNTDTIARFKTLKFGMGRFAFTPQPGKQYTAIVQFEDGKKETKPLPVVLEKGYVLSASISDSNQLHITVTATEPYGTIYLVVHSGSQTHAVLKNQLHAGNATFTLNKIQVPEGMSELTVLDENKKPVCERLYFKRPHQQLHIQTKASAEQFRPREQVALEVFADLGNNVPVPADLSIAVFLLDSLQPEKPYSIQNYLWLQSELKGRIESPDYYLDPATAEHNEALENLVLTQGWRRFRQDTVQTQQVSPAYLPEYEGHLVSGRIVNKKTGITAAHINAFLSVPGNRFQLANATSTSSGALNFVLKNDFGGEEIITQPADSSYSIEINNPFSTLYPTDPLPHFFISSYHAQQLAARSVHMQAQQAFYKEEQQHFYVAGVRDTTNFFGMPDKRYFLDNYTRFTTLEEVMREYVSEVRLRKSTDGFHFQTLNVPYKTYFEKDPLVLLDGVPVLNINQLMQFDPLKIRKLDVMARKYFFNNLVAEGIVSFTTYTQDLGGYELPSNALVTDYEGLQLKREFYAPVYNTKTAAESRLPDFRTLLYWLPQLHTNGTTPTQTVFYTSDVPGNYAIIVQGISTSGLPGSTITTFTVK